jgi:glycosyltransferase involved in cell wall biosynthesis
MSKISIIITACNEPEDELRATIASIRETTRTPLEVIVVYDGPSTGAPLQSIDKILYHDSQQGVAPSRLTGAAAAIGDCLVFMDAHHLFESEFLDSIAALALEKTAIAWGCIRGWRNKRTDAKQHGAIVRANDQPKTDPAKRDMLGVNWYSQNRPDAGRYSRSFGMFTPYAIPRAVFDRVKWHEGMRGRGNSELAVALKAYFTEVDIFHRCGPVSRHLFRGRKTGNTPPCHSSMRWWQHNNALSARICFTDKTWANYWWPEVFSKTGLRRDDYDADEVVSQQVAFSKIKRRPDSEVWRGLIHAPVPAGVSDI